MRCFSFNCWGKLRSIIDRAALRTGLIAAGALIGAMAALPAYAQRADSKSEPVVVQPGAPGQPTRQLPASTKAVLPARSRKDVEFMQGMIMHHAQAVEMTAIIESRTANKNVRLLGDRIRQSQSDEISFMKRWLEVRGEAVSPQMDMADHQHHTLMPGMLTAKQMDALKKAKGPEFNGLFLAGMIQHHKGALVMVEDLFNTAGAGQDAELFNFASDVDSGQRAEIRSMETLLAEKP
jgi:uncharacterized protein (DUF305 family)